MTSHESASNRAGGADLLATLMLGPARRAADSLDRIARDYVRLVLEIGERDQGYVDAYYGPAQWRRAAHAHPRTVDELAAAAEALKQRAGSGSPSARTQPGGPPPARSLPASSRPQRLACACSRAGPLTFTEEARGMYGIELHLLPLTDFDPVLARIERSCRARARSRTGSMPSRTGSSFRPTGSNAVMRAAIAECRRRTLAHIPLPARRGVHAGIRHPPELVGL